MLVVGLGNPGKEYTNTRHNVGFMALDLLSERHKFSFEYKSKFNSDIASCEIDNRKTILCKPQTFMNLSGKAVIALCSYYKISPEHVIVIHDDIDLEIGRIKYKIGGGAGGHNGLKSIDQAIGAGYFRVRIGVGRPKDARFEVSDYVLSEFTSEDKDILSSTLNKVCDNIGSILDRKCL